MLVNLAYGRTGLPVEFPDDRTTVIEPTYLDGLPDQHGAVRGALEHPNGTAPLRELVNAGQTVAISVCDITRPMPSTTVLPLVLDALAHVPPDQIAPFISHEHPQTIAIVLVHLEPDLAGQILQFLPEKTRSEVLLRIALLDKVDPEIVEEISNALEEELQAVGGTLGRKLGGSEKAAEILTHAGRELEDEILSDIEEENPNLAEEIRKYLFTFEDFLQVDDLAIQTLLREISTDDLRLALKGASEEVREKFFRNMSERAATLLREDLEVMGPVRLSDVERAQQNIIKVAKRLEQEGKIILGRGEEEFV